MDCPASSPGRLAARERCGGPWCCWAPIRGLGAAETAGDTTVTVALPLAAVAGLALDAQDDLPTGETDETETLTSSSPSPTSATTMYDVYATASDMPLSQEQVVDQSLLELMTDGELSEEALDKTVADALVDDILERSV